MKSEAAEERLARLEELAADATTEGLEAGDAAELADLQRALGEEGAAARLALEEAAALVVLAARPGRGEQLPSGLRRRLQERSFEAFDRSAPVLEAPSTTTGANVVSLAERAPTRRTSSPMWWAAAAVLLIAIGFVASSRPGPPGATVAAPAPTASSVTVFGDDAGRTLTVAWRDEAPRADEPLHLFVRRGDEDFRDVGALVAGSESPRTSKVRLERPLVLPASFRIAGRAPSGGPRADGAHWDGEVSPPPTPR